MMTTIISAPFDQGVVLISDTRATDHRYHQYISYDKVTKGLGYSIYPDVSFYIGGAGASIGTQTVVYPFLKYLERKSTEYCINLNDLDLPQFIEYINTVSATYVNKEITSMQLSIIEHCQFLIVVKSPKFLAAFKSVYLGGLVGGVDTLNQFKDKPSSVNNASLFEGVGSGSMYILGALLLENQNSPLYLKTEEQIVNWAKKYFKQGIARDLASSTDNGLNIKIIYRDKRQTKDIKV